MLAQRGLALDETVGVINGRGHQHVGLIGSVAEHQALVAGALLVLLAVVHPHGYVVGLLADGVQHRAGCAVKAHVGAVVANIENDLAHHVLQVDVGLGGHLAGNDGHAGLDHCLHRDPGFRVVLDDGVQDGVGDLVRHLVRMTLGD